MSDRLSVGDYSLEVTDHAVVIRDARGSIVETVDLGTIQGDLRLPDGRQVDIAALLADADASVSEFRTAAGLANDGNLGASSTSSPISFRAFNDNAPGFTPRHAAGILGDTSLSYGNVDGDSRKEEEKADLLASAELTAIPVTWSQHDPWQIPENQSGGVFGSVVDGDPEDYTFTISDPRFEIVDGILRVKDGNSFDFETEPSVDLTVTATSRTGETQSQSVHIDVVDVNEAQAALALDGSQIVENAPGTVIGNLTVIDPDAGDSQSFAVSDNRFEVVNGQLKLKDGISLDFESEPDIDVTVTATDKAGHQIQEVFAITVEDANEAPTGIQLSNASVAENSAGAAIGKLTTSDPDAGDTHTYQISDNRFEVVGGQLQLKSGIAFDHETEPSVNLKVTSTDSAGHATEQSFTITVTNVNEAPVVTVQDGSVANHIVDTSTAYHPAGSTAIGDFLLKGSNGTSALDKFGAGQINGIDPANVTLAAPTEVKVTFQREGAGYHNMVGVYQFDDAGKIIPGSVKFVWLDATATKEGQVGSPLVKDFLGFSQPGTVSLGTMAAGTHLGFFTIADGAGNGSNQSTLKALAGSGNTQADAMAAINSELSVVIDAKGNGHVYAGGKQLAGDTYFTHDEALNTDFNAGKDIEHAMSGISSTLDGQLIVGFEDLNGGGDRDYEDVVFSVSMGAYNVNKLTQTVLQPSVDFADIDSSALSQAVIHSSGFQAGDVLNVPPSGLFDVAITQSGSDYTITIAGKTGAETVDQYESFVNSIYFSTSSKAEGDRHIDYSIVDEGGLTSSIGHSQIGVSNSFDISSSELGSQATLGSGDDHLHLNSAVNSDVDFGEGHDTLHLARINDSLGHSDFVKMENVEAIDTAGFGGNKVALSITDVLDMTDADNHLTVLGDKGDVVTLAGDGSGHHWTVADTGSEFTTYVWSDPVHQAVVEISNQLTAQLG